MIAHKKNSMNKEENENEVYNALLTTFNSVEEAVEELGLSKRVKWKTILDICVDTLKKIKIKKPSLYLAFFSLFG